MDGVVEKTQLAFRVPLDMAENFQRIAKVLDRDQSWVMLRALRQYLDTEGADIIQEAAGLESLDRGEGVEFDAALDEANAIVARAKADRVGNAD